MYENLKLFDLFTTHQVHSHSHLHSHIHSHVILDSILEIAR